MQTITEILEQLKARALVNHKTSNRYQSVDTGNLLKSIDDILVGQEYQTKILWDSRPTAKSTKHTVQITLGSDLKIAGDACKPRLLLTNSFNAESSLRVNVGLLRLACSNGLVVGDNMYSDRVVHLRNEITPDRLRRLSDSLYAALDWLQFQLQDRIQPMLAPLSSDKERNVIQQMLDSGNLSKRRADMILFKLAARPYLRVADRQQNAWTLYNICNEVIGETSRTETGAFSANTSLLDTVYKLSYDQEG